MGQPGSGRQLHERAAVRKGRKGIEQAMNDRRAERGSNSAERVLCGNGGCRDVV